MNIHEVQLRYPVLGVTPDHDIWGFRDLKGLTTCGPATLRDNMQLGMELIDADGARWRVVSVRKLGWAGSLLSQIANIVFAAKPQFAVEQEIEALPSLTLREVQERVCTAMAAHPEYWGEEYEVGPELAERMQQVRATPKIAEVHELLGLDTFQNY